jgi:hypothetical protein
MSTITHLLIIVYATAMAVFYEVRKRIRNPARRIAIALVDLGGFATIGYIYVRRFMLQYACIMWVHYCKSITGGKRLGFSFKDPKKGWFHVTDANLDNRDVTEYFRFFLAYYDWNLDEFGRFCEMHKFKDPDHLIVEYMFDHTPSPKNRVISIKDQMDLITKKDILFGEFEF